MLTVKKFTFNPLAENTYVVFDKTKQCAIVDPGCVNEQERNVLINYIEQEKLKPTLLLNTHCHVDHVPGNTFIQTKYAAPFMAHELDLPLLREAPNIAKMFGMICPPSPEPTSFLSDGDFVSIGNEQVQVFFTPGHSPGSVSFYNEKDAWVIVGDVLFLGSVGRYDFPNSDGKTLFRSIENKLLTLPDNTKVYSGHGPDTTIGNERKNNPFLRAEFRAALDL